MSTKRVFMPKQLQQVPPPPARIVRVTKRAELSGGTTTMAVHHRRPRPLRPAVDKNNELARNMQSTHAFGSPDARMPNTCDIKPELTTGSLAWQHMLKHLHTSPSSPQARRKLVLDASLGEMQTRSEPRVRKRKLVTDEVDLPSALPSSSTPQLLTPDTMTANRLDSSLKLLTERFVHMGNGAINGVVHLNEAAQSLGVPKRRLYDITNVLEGIDMVEKIGKNSIRWKAVGQSDEWIKYEEALKIRSERDEVDEADLDDMIHALTAQLQAVKTDPMDAQYAYVHYSDVRHTAAHLIDATSTPADRMLIVVRSPHASHVMVHSPNDEGTHEMVIRSRDERPVEVYLCPQEEAGAAEPEEKNHLNMPMPDLGTLSSNEMMTFDNLDTPIRMIPNDEDPHLSPFKRCALSEHMAGDVMLAQHASPHKGDIVYEHYSNRRDDHLPFTPSKLVTLTDGTGESSTDETTAELTSAGIMSC